MPPKAKHTKEDIIRTALDITREKGISAVTAAEISNRIGTSVSPIFTHFDTIEEIREEVKAVGWGIFDHYLKIADNYDPAFKMRGMQMVRFAKEEPALFRSLFMREKHPVRFDELMEQRIHGFEKDIAVFVEDYHTTPAEAQHLFYQLWIHTYGICVLCATGVADFSDEEIARLLGEAFVGMMAVIKSDHLDLSGIFPATRETKEK